MRKLLLALCAPALLLAACTFDGGGSAPQLPSQVTAVSQTAIKAAANAFDAALYGLDFAMDAHLIVPGSAQAKQIAAVGRKVQAALNAADAALSAGNSANAAEALQHANDAIAEFKQLLPAARSTSMWAPPLTPHARSAVLERATA